jgi:cytochrome c
MKLPFRRINLGLVALVQLALAVLLGLALSGSPEPGAAVPVLARDDDGPLRSCVACHQIDGPVHKVGPHLMGLLGRRAGSAKGFDYSAAMRKADFVWTEERLRAYLLDPQAVVPGTSMAIGKLEPAAADEIVAYLAGRD